VAEIKLILLNSEKDFLINYIVHKRHKLVKNNHSLLQQLFSRLFYFGHVLPWLGSTE